MKILSLFIVAALPANIIANPVTEISPTATHQPSATPIATCNKLVVTGSSFEALNGKVLVESVDSYNKWFIVQDNYTLTEVQPLKGYVLENKSFEDITTGELAEVGKNYLSSAYVTTSSSVEKEFGVSDGLLTFNNTAVFHAVSAFGSYNYYAIGTDAADISHIMGSPYWSINLKCEN